MHFSQAVEYLEGLHMQRDEWDLSLIEQFLRDFKMPHKRMGTIIHVTGSNGKGSTCAMVANILKEAGYKVGLYTSPHLRRITERIRVDGDEIGKEVFASYVQKVRAHVSGHSFFEVMTAIAFLYFAEQQVDFSIVEVGMGGTLDATNVVESSISVITNVSLEHTKRLGKTEEAIARDKAGIIKEGTICVTATSGDALRVIEEVCAEKGTELLVSRRTDFSRLGLRGDIQKVNAGTAIKIIKALKRLDIDIAKMHILHGLETVQWPGRLEFVEKEILVDVAHNPAGALHLGIELRELKKQFPRLILIFGVLADKDYKAMLDELVDVADTIILTKPKSHRATEPGILERYLVKNYSLDPLIVENPKMALEKAKRVKEKGDLIVVTGSFFTVAEVY